MTPLQELAKADTTWNLDDFVEEANKLLPQYLPEEAGSIRVRDDINPRLVRHYTTQGMLDEPLKEGREARYVYRHLLQLLVLRRLLAEGHSASTIGDLAKSKSNPELEAMLEGGVQLTFAPANPALAFIDNIKKRSNLQQKMFSSPKAPSGITPGPQPIPSKTDSRWTRYELLPGLELHVNEDFRVPKSLQEQENLLRYINRKLIEIQQRRGK